MAPRPGLRYHPPMRFKRWCGLALLALAAAFAAPRRAPAQTPALRIYFVDVEGGQSTLLVTPTGQSLLIDTGWPGFQDRDAARIAAAAKAAGLSRIDFVLLTHYHVDHAGGVPQLVAAIPVGTFIDHGPLRETSPATVNAYNAYQQVLASGKYGHLTPNVGDVLPLTGVTATVVSSDGKMIQRDLPGGGQPNRFCSTPDPWPADTSENERSLGVLVRLGQFTLLDVGDLVWNVDHGLVCPDNRLGPVSLLVMPNHGMIPGASHALVEGTGPRVIVFDNGAHKGAAPDALDMARATPGLEGLWQLHYADASAAHNAPAPFIANLAEGQPRGAAPARRGGAAPAYPGPDAAYDLEVTAGTSGAFSVLNPRTHQTVTYPAH